jgi:Domain of unknown function (DUF4303)
MPDEINLHELETLLLPATRAAFIAVQQQHPDEHFYAFSLFHEPLWEGVMPAANTEEALARRAEVYHNFASYTQETPDQLKTILRWSAGDWEYLDSSNLHFAPVNDWLLKNVLWEWLGDLDDKSTWEQRYASVLEICRSTLKQLDVEGIFGVGAARETVTLNIMLGDQDRSWIEHARLLNPPAVYQRWLHQLRDARLF